MPSQPFRRAFLAKLKERDGGWGAILERIADGEGLRPIAADYGCSPSWLSWQMRKSPELSKLYAMARREGARALVEDALDKIDTVRVDRDEIAKVKLQVEHRRWLAEKYDRETFGDGPAVQVNVQSLGDLHLAAISTPRPPRALPSGSESSS